MASTALAWVLWCRWLGILVMFQGMEPHSGIRTGSHAAALARDGIPSRQANARSVGSAWEVIRYSETGLPGQVGLDR